MKRHDALISDSFRWTAYSKRFSTRAETRFAEQVSGNSCERSYGWDADAPWDSRCLRSRVRSGRLRIHARDSEALLKSWLERWPYENLRWLGYSWVEPDMEDVFMAYSQGFYSENRFGKEKYIGELKVHQAEI